jgi:serine/threonine-protein kinase
LIYSGTPRLTQFTWYDRSGRVLGTVGAPGGYHFGPFGISPDGRTIAASLDQAGGAQMGLLEIDRGIFGGLPQSNNNSFPAWAPDSRSLAYGRTIIDVAKGSPIQELAGNPWDWSPDGRQLIYRRVIQGVRSEMLAQAMTPDHKFDGAPRVLAEGMYARFSPDGRWVAFTSPESGEDEVYIVAFSNPLGKVRVSTAGGNSPVWSPNGREVYYVQPGNKLMAVSLKIAADSLQLAAPKDLFVLPVSDTPLSPFDVTKDGRILVRADVQQGSRALSAIVNWETLIK